MKKQIDFILLGTLWVLAVALGAGFWFNTQFGFDIFSGAHWAYLGGIQASGATVRPIFYASIAVTVTVLVGGMYLLMLPRVRGLRLGARMRRRDRRKMTPPPAQPAPTHVAPVEKTSTPDIADVRPGPAPAMTRPPRLNFGINPPVRPATPTAAPMPTTSSRITTGPDDATIDKMKTIFTDAGYTVKPNPRITGIPMALWAIGGGETLWMGTVGIPVDRMTTALGKVKSIFHDTLDDIVIHTHAFTIGTGTGTDDVHVFATMDDLRDYIAAHPATEIPDGGQDDFDAYGEYIDTVANYLNKG